MLALSAMGTCYEKLPKSTVRNSAFSRNVPAHQGAAVQSVSAFIQTLSKLGKLIEVIKSEKDEAKQTKK